MSSGSLPLETYHRASSIGAGTYGSVVTVYNDDGEEFALKLFYKDENDDEEEEDAPVPLDLGTLRELSILRLLRGDNAHSNILAMHDVQPEWVESTAEDSPVAVGLALPLIKSGNLAASIGKFGKDRRSKVKVAHDLLSAVAYLHDNDIMHRDIKSDNILIDSIGEDGFKAILIDFSLAKIVGTSMYAGRLSEDEFIDQEDDPRHTGEVGTVGYTPPEIVNGESYGKSMDLWSVGVVLLELLRGELFSAIKPKEAFSQIRSALEALPTDQPFPNLIRGLLQEDPNDRLTARQALDHEVFAKFGFAVPPIRLVNVETALPYATDEEDREENNPPNTTTNNKSKRKDPVLEKRKKLIDKTCHYLGSEHILTRQAALEYCQQLFQLDDELDDITASQGLLDCVVLAHRFFEFELPNLDDLEEEDKGVFANWSLETYVDNEATLLMLLDYCLFPRSPTIESE